MRDFTLEIYKKLLKTLIEKQYNFITENDFSPEKCLFMRHDVDRNPENALKMAFIENKLGVNTTYYFRVVKNVNDPVIMQKIANLGHRIGYHYEDLTTFKGEIDKAYESFVKNLTQMRKVCHVESICMHGLLFLNGIVKTFGKSIIIKN